MPGNATILTQLMSVIEDRKRNPPERSYTTRLFAGGVSKIGDKLREETDELIEAADEPEDQRSGHVVHEAADLLYHLLVMLAHCDVPLSDVEDVLAQRFGISGLDEKASRQVADSNLDKNDLDKNTDG